MAASGPVRPLNPHGNDCPICKEAQVPGWRGANAQLRFTCCGVLICRPCVDDWEKERTESLREFEQVCGWSAKERFMARMSKKLRARTRGEKDKEAAQSKKKGAGKGKGGSKEEEKKRALEKKLERHCTCPSCRAPMPWTDEDQFIQVRRKAEQGHSWAQRLLGAKYHEGAGVQKDARQAERWFRAAMTDMSVMDGGPMAACILGLVYANCDGVRKDVEEVKKLWMMAHEAGHFHATYNLGALFEGRYGPAAGVPDLKKAVALYRQAAEAGHATAQFNLGVCYETGEGVEQDKEKAKAWYAKAAKQGLALAMGNLANMLHQTEGAAAMPAIMALMRAAAEKDNAQAKEFLPKFEEEILSQCASCGKPRAAMAEDPKRCNRCFAVAYCSPKCQKEHWKRGGHKTACNERMKYLPDEG